MPQSLCISPVDQKQLLLTARMAIASRWQNNAIAKNSLPLSVKDKQLGNFVSLHIQGALRGCIGLIETNQPLSITLVSNALSCAFNDPRFPPLTKDELAQCQIEISLLSPTHQLVFNRKIDLLTQLKPTHGLILEDTNRLAVFLPQVWQQLPKPQQFVDALLRKGGWSEKFWSDRIKARTFTSLVIAEST
ncbi:AmmeMemoRadiSam system protein A [Moritella sp. Urea-trap-13]|uniref:AmmeMemoRadiSam system protein A n=1 Tax=Moritella sp. Urea-trap-13 TaxID=2058327 RepID=UPI0012FF032F|nr:AmmeMemoRadiSam system protein A [Moritella sp. Urea-trap-13]